MDLGRKLKKALLSVLSADHAVTVAKSDISRREAEHTRLVARAQYQKAHTKLKRAKRQKLYKAAGLL